MELPVINTLKRESSRTLIAVFRLSQPQGPWQASMVGIGAAVVCFFAFLLLFFAFVRLCLLVALSYQLFMGSLKGKIAAYSGSGCSKDG